MPPWWALAEKMGREMPVLSVTGRDLGRISRLMLAIAAYDPTRVTLATCAVHTGIRHDQRADRGRSAPMPHGLGNSKSGDELGRDLFLCLLQRRVSGGLRHALPRTIAGR
ncbi:hypothetical protein BH23CHL9_BH23CHL9_13480 [soil metagenome]